MQSGVIMGYCYYSIWLANRWFAIGSVPVDTIPDISENQQIVFATMADMTNTFNSLGETIYVQHCPMADDNKGADWLSTYKEI